MQQHSSSTNTEIAPPKSCARALPRVVDAAPAHGKPDDSL